MVLEIPSNVANYFQEVCKKSQIFNAGLESKIPKYNLNELVLGRVLGRGGFCTVNEVSKISLVSSHEEGNNEEARGHMSREYRRDGDARYAIKKLHTDLDKDGTIKGIMDLALEAKFLSALDHPHIIKIRGVAVVEPLSKGYFVILDRLYNTLEAQCLKWGMKKRTTSGVGKVFDMKGKKKQDLLIERIGVAYDIASAVNHLHKLGIVYRDLCPDNVGFDVRGSVKIFDFGLAKELSLSTKLPDGNYKLTGYTGSIRYMAPEVMKCEPYNQTADVFSFGVLQWYIMSCQIPYKQFTIKMYERCIVQNGARPTINKNWPKGISSLMSDCWLHDAKKRPDMETARKRLRDVIVASSADKQDELDLDMSKRSKHGSKFNKKTAASKQ